MALQYRQLGHDGLRVSSIGLGCVTLGREIDAATSFRVLDRAVERGINLFDTAAVYGDGSSELVIGRWLQERRPAQPPVIATKVSGRLAATHILQSVHDSLGRLGVERIDLLQAHEWDPETPLEETLETFALLVEQGKVRFLGVSNWTSAQLAQALELAEARGWQPLRSVQPIYSLAHRTIEADLLPLCAARGVGVMSYSPLGAGFLTGKYRRDAEVPKGTRFDIKPGHQRHYFTDHGFRVAEGLREVASRSGLPMVHLALGWVLRRPGITTVLVGARDPAHVDQALHAWESPPGDEILRELDRLSELPATGAAEAAGAGP
jgi:aryl-alcohol dehydrogenase-like predicted oxidoreductase